MLKAGFYTPYSTGASILKAYKSYKQDADDGG